MRATGDGVREMIGLSRRMSPEERLAGAVILRAIQDCARMYRRHQPTESPVNRTPETQDAAPSARFATWPPTRGGWRSRATTRTRYVCRDYGLKQSIDAVTARTFLSQPSEILSFWCNILGVSPELIINVYTRTIRQTAP